MEVNTRPLLQSNSESESENDISNETINENSNEDLIRIALKPLEPKDKYRLCYFIFYLLGITTLIPWNFFITADDVSIPFSSC